MPLHRATALCGCHYASLHSGFVWLTTSILAWTRGGSPSNIAPARMPGVYATRLCRTQSQPSIHSPSHGEGVWGFGKDAEIERPKALQDAKPTKRSYRDREFALSYKKQTFSTNWTALNERFIFIPYNNLSHNRRMTAENKT